MKIVSESSDAEMKANRVAEAQERAEGALVELAANLLRVIRGAGRSYDLVQQSHDFLQAVKAYYAIKGEAPFDPFRETALSVRRDVSSAEFGRTASLRADGENMMLRGALQIAASRLLGQRAQEAAGSEEMHRGIRVRADANEMDAEARRQARVVNEPSLAGQDKRPAGSSVRRGRPRKPI